MDEMDRGSDSDENEWKIGYVDSDDDSDLDSNKAPGESDEKRFADFTFRGTSAEKKKKKGNLDKAWRRGVRVVVVMGVVNMEKDL